MATVSKYKALFDSNGERVTSYLLGFHYEIINNKVVPELPSGVVDISVVILTPVCRSTTYTGSSPTSAPNMKALTINGFSALLTGTGSTWDLYYYAVAK